MFETPPRLLACFLARLKDSASPNPRDVDVRRPTRRARFVPNRFVGSCKISNSQNVTWALTVSNNVSIHLKNDKLIVPVSQALWL